MKKGLQKILPLSVLLTLAVTGCADNAPVSVTKTVQKAESTAAVSAVSDQYRDAEENPPEAETGAVGVEGIHEPPDDAQPLYGSHRKKPSGEQLEAALNALQHYFGITPELEEYVTSSRYLPEETFEGELYEAQTTIRFNALDNNFEWNDSMENRYVKPDYSVSFLESGEIKAIYLQGMYTVWDRALKPPTVEEAKTLTRQFLLSTKLFEEKDIELLGAGYANDTSIAVVYKDGKDGGIVVAVDVASGNIDCFDRMSRNRAMKWITPIEAGSGKG